jgi:4-hydroxy-2-oxoheptanedioate aldolase
MVEVIKDILNIAKSAGIYAGIHCGSAKYAAKAISWGFNFTTISNDVRILATAASNLTAETREQIGVCEGRSRQDRGGY